MMLNMLNVHTTEMITAGMMVGFSDGSVMFTNCCHFDAPSMVAASYMSCEIDCSPPRMITIMNGKLSQPLVISPVMKAANTPSNQATGSPPNIWIA